MPVKGVELEVTEGITEHSSRVALKGVFQNFGDVVACWVPPIDRRAVDRASVRFGNATSAEAAKQACDSGQVFLQGLPVKVDYRTGGGRRVGNSDLGESAANNEDGKARAIMDASGTSGRSRRSRSRRRRSRSRSRGGGRRSRSRDRRRSRSRRRSRDRFAEVPALPAPAPPPLAAAPPGQDFAPPPSMSAGFPGMPPTGMIAAPGFPQGGMGQLGMGVPPTLPDPSGLGTPIPVYDPLAEAKKKAEIAAAREARAKQLKRGPGVAALVQGALKRALTQPSVAKKAEDDKADKSGEAVKEGKKVQVDSESDVESEETIRKKKEEQARIEAQKKKEKEEREAKERERKEREARERREQAKREAAEAEKALQREAETREQRIKASVEAAKKQQAERAALKAAQEASTTDNLYANMPQPELEDMAANEARKQEAVQRETDNKNLSFLPPEDRSKVLFLDVDGVLRPARAGGFDIQAIDSDAAKNVDTSDFFPSAVKALRHIIERTSAKIVLSSEWRRSEPLCNALNDVFVKNKVRTWSSKTVTSFELAAGADPVRSFAERRAREISNWLQEHEREVSGWVVLDDINLGVADEARKAQTKVMQPHLVQTWPLCGLTMGNAKTAVRILNGEMINKVVVERPVAPVGSASTAAGGGAAKK
mmetsp:Transcript_147915/g.368575  ORF Transcript_147915/g.368575 Transcript_147915/m.368575 type:complete len:654 (+) Transcript_147915:133-2094(+)